MFCKKENVLVESIKQKNDKHTQEYPSSWLNVCGDGKAHSRNLNALCSSVIYTMFFSIKYILQTELTCICENLR